MGVPHRAEIRPADNPSGCPNGARHTSPGCNPGYGCGNGLRSVGTPPRARVGGRSGDMQRSFRTHLIYQRSYPGRCPGLVWVAPLGQFRMRLPYRAGTRPSTGQDKADDDPLGVPQRAEIRPADNPSGCPNGAQHTSPGCNPGSGCAEGLRSVGTPHRASPRCAAA